VKGTLSPQPLSTTLQWIAEKAKSKSFQYWTLAHHITLELLQRSYEQVRKEAAPGIDGVTKEQYAQQLGHNLRTLHTRLEKQRYRAPAIRRAWIPKGDGKRRPLGITTLEDKIVQRAVVTLLEGIYEQDFYDCSYGYRRGKSCHQALEAIWQQTMRGMQWIIDADISSYFTTIDHGHLREFLTRRVVDRSINRLIGKWLNAGVLENEALHYPEQGTPQGGVISPMLANIYLHYVLDEWFAEVVQPRLRGRAFLVRVADDFVIGCQYREDAHKIMEVLPKRMQRYGLTMHATKTRLIDFTKPSQGVRKGHAVFDFLGLRHYWAKSRRGKWVVKRKTAPDRLRRTMRRIRDWCRMNRHQPVKQQHRRMCQKLQGHYNYFGITGNYRSLNLVYRWGQRQWHKWLNRRGGDGRSWDQFKNTILKSFPLVPPRVVHSVM